MPKFIHRRQGASFAIVKDQSFPATVNVGYGGVSTEVATVSDFVEVETGASAETPVEPAAANQVLRWHFLNSETGGTDAARVNDNGPDGAHGRSANLGGYTSTSQSYVSEDGSPTGAWGMYFSGPDAYQNRLATASGVTLTKLVGAEKIRFVIGVHPAPWTDRPAGDILRITPSVSAGAATFNLRRMPSNALEVVYDGVTTTFENFFTNNVTQIVEVEVAGNVVSVFRNFVKVGKVARNSSPVFTTPALWVGNERNGGRAPNVYYSYLGVFVGDLSEREIAWARGQAKTQIEARPGGLNSLDAVPDPLPVGALQFSVPPETIPASFQTVGSNVQLLSGRAIDGLGGPIDLKTRVLFGPLPDDGVEQPVTDLSFLPTEPGYLTLEQTADNGVQPPVVARKVLPIAQSFTPLTPAQVGERLGATVNIIDNFDAGFPSDMVWRPEMVVDPGDGTVGLRILRNTGPGRKYQGGSVQFRMKSGSGAGDVGSARIFSVDWTFQLIDTRGADEAKGYIQTGFTFTAPFNAPRRELDFEYNSKSGYMECTIHLAANGGGPASVAQTISIVPPEEAFTGMREWSIVSNSDRVEWFYEDQLLTRYVRGAGWDSSVQTFAPKRDTGGRVYVDFLPGDTLLHPRDEHWHLNAQNVFIQQWMTDTNAVWLGPNTVPITHPLLRFSAIDAQEFGPANTALVAGDWTAVAGGAGQVVVNVSAYRPARFRPSHLEYSVDGGAWVRLPGTTGNQTISGLTAGSRAIRLRPVAESLATNPLVTASNYTMNADPSDTKNVTVT